MSSKTRSHMVRWKGNRPMTGTCEQICRAQHTRSTSPTCTEKVEGHGGTNACPQPARKLIHSWMQNGSACALRSPEATACDLAANHQHALNMKAMTQQDLSCTKMATASTRLDDEQCSTDTNPNKVQCITQGAHNLRTSGRAETSPADTFSIRCTKRMPLGKPESVTGCESEVFSLNDLGRTDFGKRPLLQEMPEEQSVCLLFPTFPKLFGEQYSCSQCATRKMEDSSKVDHTSNASTAVPWSG